MKTTTIYVRLAKALMRLFATLTMSVLFVMGGSCSEDELREYDESETCFTKESLETSQWIRDELQWFQQPKMGSLRVAVYRYKSSYYLAFENSLDSGPVGHIFNCAGQNLGDLEIHYNEFYDNAELMAILIAETY